MRNLVPTVEYLAVLNSHIPRVLAGWSSWHAEFPPAFLICKTHKNVFLVVVKSQALGAPHLQPNFLIFVITYHFRAPPPCFLCEGSYRWSSQIRRQNLHGKSVHSRSSKSLVENFNLVSWGSRAAKPDTNLLPSVDQGSVTSGIFHQ